MKKLLSLILAAIISIGSITLVAAETTKTIGDVDNDNKISVNDATKIQKFIAGIIEFDTETIVFADTNGDYKISVLDVTNIQKYVAGIINHFPVDKEETPTTEPTTKPTEPITKPETVTPNEMEMEVFRLVNVERVKLGRKELKFGDFFYEAAKTRAKEIDTLFSHTRPDGRNCFTALLDIGVNTNLDRYVGENCARYFADAESIVKAFMNSDGHRMNMVSTDYDYLAVAVYESEQNPGYYTCVQLFLSDIVD